MRVQLQEAKTESNLRVVAALVEAYRAEKMPRRAMTRQGYNTWLNQYVLPVGGNRPIQELQARRDWLNPIFVLLREISSIPPGPVFLFTPIRTRRPNLAESGREQARSGRRKRRPAARSH